MTIGAAHTLAEAWDLIRNWDPQLKWLQGARDATAADSSWSNVDPTGWAKWLEDEANYENNYNEETASVRDAWNLTPTFVANETPDEAAYQRVLTAVQNGSTPSPGGFDDLVRRAQASPAASHFGGEPAPVQPIAPDADLTGYQKADSALAAVGSAVQAATDTVKQGLQALPAWVPWAIGGGLALYAMNTLTNFKKAF